MSAGALIPATPAAPTAAGRMDGARFMFIPIREPVWVPIFAVEPRA